jgi:hypothetical protein
MDQLAQAVLIWDQERSGNGASQVCDRSDSVKAGVEAYLGRAVFGADPSLVIRVHISHKPGDATTTATVTQEDATGKRWGERSLSAASCDTLDEPLTLVVALMIDAGSTAAPSASQPPATAPQPTPVPLAPSAAAVEPVSTEPIETAPSLQRASREPGHWAVFASAEAGMGFLPDPSLGLGVHARLKPTGFWGLSFDASALQPQRQALDSGRLKLSLARAGLGLCPLEGADADTWWSACASVGVGRLQARSSRLVGAQTRVEWLALPALSVTGAWLPRGWLLLAAGLEGAFPVLADRYVYRDALGNQHLAFQMSSFTLTARLGIGLIVR